MTNQARGEGHLKIANSAAGVAAGVTATLPAVAGDRIIATHISGSGDLAALVTVESPSGTVVWRKRFAAAFTFSETFKYGELQAAEGQAILVRISASTANSEANIAGLQVGL